MDFAMPTSLPMPRWSVAFKRGFSCRCPNCGKGHLYQSYLKLVDRCEVCGDLQYPEINVVLPAMALLNTEVEAEQAGGASAAQSHPPRVRASDPA